MPVRIFCYFSSNFGLDFSDWIRIRVWISDKIPTFIWVYFILKEKMKENLIWSNETKWLTKRIPVVYWSHISDICIATFEICCRIFVIWDGLNMNSDDVWRWKYVTLIFLFDIYDQVQLQLNGNKGSNHKI